MRKFLLAMFVVIFSTSPLLTLAQTDIPEDSEEPISELNSEEQAEFLPIIPEQQAIPNTTSCFDDYKFGSVQTDISPVVLATVPGVPITFSGKIKNDNPYPIVDGSVYIKIFKKQATHSNTDLNTKQNGPEVVDQFFAKENISIKANDSTPILFVWNIPRNAESGDYQAATYFVTAKRFNLSGLSFTDDVTGNKVDFSIKSDVINPPAYFNKNTVTLNQKPHKFAIFPLHFPESENVTAEAELINPSKVDKTITLTWKLYKWDGLREENKKDEKTETITIKASETKKLSYTVNKDTGSVAYLIAEAKDKESKSILNIRFVREGIEEIRLNFPSITSYPLTQGQENSLFSCVHSTNSHIVKDNTLTLTLKTLSGETIHQYTYQGDISGSMMGVKGSFTPKETMKNFTLTATLKNQNNTIEEVTQTYLCEKLGDNCPKETTASSIPSDFLDFGENGMWLKLVLFLAGTVLLFFIIRRMVMKRSNLTFSFFFALLVAGSFLFVGTNIKVAEAQWRDESVHKLVNDNLYYVWAYTTETGNKPAAHGADVFGNPYYGVIGLVSPDITVHYKARATDLAGNVFTDNANVPVGSQIKFRFDPHMNEDIDWFGTGYYADSPDGRWVLDAKSPTSEQGRLQWGGWRPRNICDEYDLVDIEENIYGLVGGRFVVRYYPPSPPASVSGSLFCNGQVISGRFVCTATIPGRPGGDNVTVLIPLNNAPSARAFNSSEVISCTKRTARALTCTYPPADPWEIPIHIPLSVNPPTKSPISVSSNLNCGTGTPDANGYVACSVTGTGPISASMTFDSTYARFYHRQNDKRNIHGLVPGCYGANVPMNTDLDAFKKEGSDFTIPIPSATINFAFNAVPANNAPALTVISPNQTGGSGLISDPLVVSGTANNLINFTAKATDPEDDQVRYEFHWVNDIAYEPKPAVGFVNSGEEQTGSYQWPANTQAYVIAKDDSNNPSNKVYIQINIAANQKPGAPTVAGPDTGEPNVPYFFTAKESVDPDGDQIRYGFDWDNSGYSIEETPEGGQWGQGGYVNSNGYQPSPSHSWSELGNKSFQVFAQDINGNNSLTTTKNINITCEASVSETDCVCETETKTRTTKYNEIDPSTGMCKSETETIACTASEKNSCRDFNFREVAP